MKTLTKKQIEFLNKYVKNGDWKLNKKTGLIDVEGDFNCSKANLRDFFGIKFGYVTGNFDCSYNELKTLEGAPKKVKNSFICSFNELESLEGAPKKVGKDFNCSNNRLETLQGAPKKIFGTFDCTWNKLKSLNH